MLQANSKKESGGHSLIWRRLICTAEQGMVFRDSSLKGTVSRLCARASVTCFFFKRQQNCHIDSTRFPSEPHRRRRFVVYILKQYFRLSKKSFVLFKIWLAARRLIAILSLAGPPRDPKISFRPLKNRFSNVKLMSEVSCSKSSNIF